MLTKVADHREKYLKEKLSQLEIKERINNNEPKGFLLGKWTHHTIKCPACGQSSLDKFTGGANIENRDISHTEFIYHCRVCDLNITEEEYKESI